MKKRTQKEIQEETSDEKLERLKKIDDRNRESSKKFLEKKKKADFYQISALISKEAYECINNRRDSSDKAGLKALTTGEIVEEALLATIGMVDKTGHINIDLSIKNNINSNIDGNLKEKETEKKPTPSDKVIPDRDTTDLKEYKLWLLKAIDEAKNQWEHSWQEIMQELNEQNIKPMLKESWKNIDSVRRFYNKNKKLLQG